MGGTPAWQALGLRARTRKGSTAGPRKGRASLLTPLRAGCGVYWGGKADSTPSMIRSMAVPAKKAAPVSTDEPTKMTLPGVAVLSSGIPVRVPAIGDGTLRVVKVPIMCPRTACPEFLDLISNTYTHAARTHAHEKMGDILGTRTAPAETGVSRSTSTGGQVFRAWLADH